MLHEFLSSNRQELISRWRTKIAERGPGQPTESERDSCIPVFLDQLIETLCEETYGMNAETAFALSTKIETTVAIAIATGAAGGSDGNESLLNGCTVYQVALDYAELCQSVSELAGDRNVPITIDEFQTMNRCLDDAVAGTISECTRQRDRVIAISGEYEGDNRDPFLADEYRNRISQAMLAVEATKVAHAGLGELLGSDRDRSGTGLQVLTDRALLYARLQGATTDNRAPVLVSEFIGDIQAAAAIEAVERGIEFIASDVEPDLVIEIDRQVLAGALANLLQNAFRFTRPRSSISLHAFSLADRVLIVVEDECGGLPPGNAEDLFQTFGESRGDESGPGPGLGLSRRGVEANGGMLHVDNLPGRGCVFTIDLPNPSINPTVGTSAPFIPAA